MPVTAPAPRPGFESKLALRAMQALLNNPDDTAQVFVIVQALSGNSVERNFRRFQKTEAGRCVLREQRKLLSKLQDRAALAALPEGSLGRAYLEFLNREGITAEGLVAASEVTDESAFQPEFQLFRERMRDMHDLWHVLTGYHGDIVGESALLAFSFAQTWNPGLGFIVLVALARMKQLRQNGSVLVLRGFARGLRARWLPEQDWEALLSEPLERLRDELRISERLRGRERCRPTPTLTTFDSDSVSDPVRTRYTAHFSSAIFGTTISVATEASSRIVWFS
jgi:ubiquinone biosynthesis protein COQ4